jgi:hypothetical protein
MGGKGCLDFIMRFSGKFTPSDTKGFYQGQDGQFSLNRIGS